MSKAFRSLFGLAVLCAAIAAAPAQSEAPLALPAPLPLAWCLERAQAENPRVAADAAP